MLYSYFLVLILVAFLSGARNERNSQLSEEIVDRMRNLFPDLKNRLVSASILLANVHASQGDIEKSTEIRIQLNKLGMKKRIGASFTEINGKLLESSKLLHFLITIFCFLFQRNFALMIDHILDLLKFMQNLIKYPKNLLSTVINTMQVGLYDQSNLIKRLKQFFVDTVNDSLSLLILLVMQNPNEFKLRKIFVFVVIVVCE